MVSVRGSAKGEAELELKDELAEHLTSRQLCRCSISYDLVTI